MGSCPAAHLGGVCCTPYAGGGGGGTGLNLNHKLSFALSWGSLHRGGPHGTQAHETPPPCRVSAPLADPDASGGRGGTTVAGRAQSVVAGSAAAGTTRSAAAAPTHPHAPATPDAARHRGHHGELGVAAGPV